MQRIPISAALPPQPRESERLSLVESILTHAHEAVFVYELRPDPADARIVFANAAFASLKGVEAGAHVGQLPFHLSGRVAAAQERATYRYGKTDGSQLTLDVRLAALGDTQQRTTHVIAFCRDAAALDATTALRARAASSDKKNAALRREVRDRRRTERLLVDASLRDALTGLPNRLLFLERVKTALAGSRKSGLGIAVLFLDCDRFKLVNDTFGHLVGDLLLAEVAERVKGCLRSVDVLGRIGGDEFAILLSDGHERALATSIAQRISKTFAAPFNIDGEELYLTASIGIALSASGDESAEDLLRDSDIAMYHAKQIGKQRYEVFTAELRDRLMRRRLLDSELRRALERSELSVAYQPIVRLASGRLEGFEALVRWHHAQLGFISPQELIAVAEESSLIVDVGDWILGEACDELSRWQQRYAGSESLSISVNVSTKQLVDEHFTRRVCNALMQSGLRAERLHLEITESSLMLDSSLASSLLRELAKIGVRSHVDDFGTGYSSLTYLQSFPVAVLKIDRSFVSGTGDGIANPAIVKTIISLAAHLGLQVVAEGVESAEQERQLHALGCTFGQGYYFAKPLQGEALVDYLAHNIGGVAVPA